jgi:hypothetical protein
LTALLLFQKVRSGAVRKSFASGANPRIVNLAVLDSIILVQRDKDGRIFFHVPRYPVIANKVSMMKSIPVVIGAIRRRRLENGIVVSITVVHAASENI